jgi:hypothetical protein
MLMASGADRFGGGTGTGVAAVLAGVGGRLQALLEAGDTRGWCAHRLYWVAGYTPVFEWA